MSTSLKNLFVIAVLFFNLTTFQAYSQCTGCTQTITTNTAPTWTAGEVYCIDNVNFTADISFDSDFTICINSNATLSSNNINWNNSNATLINHGNITKGSQLIINGNFENYGDVTVTSGGLTFGSNSQSTLTGGEIDITGTIVFDGEIDISQTTITGSGTASFNGSSEVTITDGELDFAGGATIDGEITSTRSNISFGGSVTVNSNGELNLSQSEIDIGGALANNGVLTGGATLENCSRINIAGASVNNSTGNVAMDDSHLDICNAFGLNTGSIGTNVTNCACNVVLPVELIFFKSQLDQTNSPTLSWQTAMEINNHYFIIERSFDGFNFDSLSVIKGQGTTSKITRYKYIDNTPLISPTYYYRLKQVDFDGTFEYSPVVAVHLSKTNLPEISVSPNPIQNEKLNINLGLQNNTEMYWISIMNIQGQVLYEKTQQIKNPTLEIEIPSQKFPKGIYLLKIYSKSQSFMQKILVN